MCGAVFGSGTVGHIFEPKSLANNNAVYDYAKNNLGTYWFWIGVKLDLKYESDGSNVTIDPIPWASGYPSGSGDCLNIYIKSEWRNNNECSNPWGYAICERSGPDATTLTGNNNI